MQDALKTTPKGRTGRQEDRELKKKEEAKNYNLLKSGGYMTGESLWVSNFMFCVYMSLTGMATFDQA